MLVSVGLLQYTVRQPLMALTVPVHLQLNPSLSDHHCPSAKTQCQVLVAVVLPFYLWPCVRHIQCGHSQLRRASPPAPPAGREGSVMWVGQTAGREGSTARREESCRWGKRKGWQDRQTECQRRDSHSMCAVEQNERIRYASGK